MGLLNWLLGESDEHTQAAGSYNRIVAIHGLRGSGKTMLGASILATCPGWRIVIGKRFPTMLPDGTELATTTVKTVDAIQRAVRWFPERIVICTEGPDFEKILATYGMTFSKDKQPPPKDYVVEHALGVAIKLARGSYDKRKGTYIPVTVLIDEAVRWSSVRAGHLSEEVSALLAECRHLGIGIIYLTQTPRWIDEKVFTLSTDIYSFRTVSELDTRRLRYSGEYTEAELDSLATIPLFTAYHKVVGANQPGELISLPDEAEETEEDTE